MNDLISRQAAIDALVKAIREDPYYDSNEAINGLGVCDVRVILNDLPASDLPSAQPDIIRCRNCKFASGDSRICMKFGHSPIGELDFCAWAERRTDEE